MPATRTRKPAELEVEFVPASQPGQLLGLLQLTKGRTTGTYAVGELALDEPGRAFTLVKVSGGSDDDASGYVCKTTYGGNGLSCECRGWLRWGTPCRHLEALGQLIYKGAF